ncbi:MAG: aldo/keto reductase [Chloroflexi bacterium]|nr:MAG: aldo/keto reductase [Chloroflexota bacterium]
MLTAPLATRAFGSTPLTVTRIGVGLAALGRPGYITVGREEDLGDHRTIGALEHRCHEVLTAAYDTGVRYFDAARSYGLAEAFLASWCATRTLSDGDVTVGSKWGYTYVGAWRVDARVHEVKDHSLEALRRQIIESRAWLDGRLKLYQIHSATLDSGVLDDRAVLAVLARLQQEGLIIGLSLSGPRQAEALRHAFEVEVDGVNPFQSVQATWNLLEPSVGPALAEAHDRGWGVIVKEALANGRLTARNTAPESRRLREVAAGRAAAMDAVAIAAALANPWVDVVLSGAATLDQLRGNLGALDLALTPDDVQALSSSAMPAEQYWRSRQALAWT